MEAITLPNDPSPVPVVYSSVEVNLDKIIIKEDRLVSTTICCTVTLHCTISYLRSLTVRKIQNKLRCILLFIYLHILTISYE